MGMVQYMSMDRRFFHKLGATLLDRTLCSSAGKFGLKATLGGSVGMDPERFDEARLIILWGANPMVSNLHLWSRVQAAKRRGAKIVAIDPYLSLSAEKCTQHVALLPGTDGALALGMMHVLIGEGLIDRDYIAKYTLGFEQLAERVKQYTPEWAARICGITARRSCSSRATTAPRNRPRSASTTACSATPVAASPRAPSPACRRSPAPGARPRAASCSPPPTSTSSTTPALERPDLLAGRRPRVINQSALGDALTSAQPPVKVTIVYNNNPVAVCPDSDKVIAGFSREDLFTVVMDHFQTDTADYADIVLPATTQLEHYDVHKSYGHLYMLANNPAIAPVGESLPNSEVFRRLAARMGFDEPCFRDSDEDLCRTALERRSWEGLKQSGWRKLEVPERFAPFAQAASRRPRASASSIAPGSRSRASTRCPSTTLRPRSTKAKANIRSLSSRRRRAISSTRRSPTSRASANSKPSRTSTCIRATPRRVASPMATGCAYSTTAAATSCARA